MLTLRPYAGFTVCWRQFKFGREFQSVPIGIDHHEKQIVARTMTARAEENADALLG